jgi:hypothetical protein
MLLTIVYDRFAAESPLTLMTRMTLEHTFSAPARDAVFEQTRAAQYTRALTFSAVVDLMGLVVTGVRPSVNDAYHAVRHRRPVSLTAVYDKLQGLELPVATAMVHHVATRAGAVIEALGGALPAPLPGRRVRILDGNHLAATERRLAVARGSHAGPLPGLALVVLDPQHGVPVAVVPCEDAYTQERALWPQLAPLITAGDCWLGDRNFCTVGWLFTLHDRHATSVIREHANLPLRVTSRRKFVRRIDDGRVYTEWAEVCDEDGRVLRLRRITLVLDRPTRDGDREIRVLTTLPVREADAAKVLALYRRRWTVEKAFFEMATILDAELKPLGYPRAALFGFCVGLVAYTMVATLRAALRAQHGADLIEATVSNDHIATDVRAGWHGLTIMTTDADWEPYRTMPASELAAELKALAAHVRLGQIARKPRGLKKPVPPRTRFRDRPHVSTQRLLEGTPQSSS